MSIPNTPQDNASQQETPQTIVVDAPAAANAAPTAAPAAPAYAAPAPAAAAPAAAAAASDSNPLSITSFVLGICSIVLGWTFIAPIVGLVLGIMARKREPHSRTFANWGIGLNAAMLALTVIGLIVFFIFLAFMLPFIAADSAYYWN